MLIDQDKCRGWRMCVSGCPYKKIYYNWKSGKAEKCIFCYPRIEAGQPTVCSETCVGRIRYLGVLLYDADRIQEAASVEHDTDLYQAQLDIFLDPNDPKVIAQARARRHSRDLDGRRAQQPGLQDGGGLEGGPAAAPRVPHAAHGLVRAAALADHRRRQRRPDGHQRRDPGRASQLRIPVKYLANLLTAGDTLPVERALERMLAMRAYQRAKHVDGIANQTALEQVKLEREPRSRRCTA